jgi:uncharacterized protein with HEPN domain
MPPDDATALLDIERMCRLVAEVVQISDEETFTRNVDQQHLVLHRLAIMGEATKRLSMEFRLLHVEIEWSAIAGLRDVIMHRYDIVDIGLIWDIATNRVPRLLAYLEAHFPMSSEDEPLP